MEVEETVMVLKRTENRWDLKCSHWEVRHMTGQGMAEPVRGREPRMNPRPRGQLGRHPCHSE